MLPCISVAFMFGWRVGLAAFKGTAVKGHQFCSKGSPFLSV